MAAVAVAASASFGASEQGAAAGADLLTDSTAVREWLQQHHRKQVALLDKFLLELRLGTRLSTSSSGRLVTALRTLEVCRHIIGSVRWRSAAQLLSILKGIGAEIHVAAGGSKQEPAIANVVRRVMAAVREEALREEEQQGENEEGAAATSGGSGRKQPGAGEASAPGGRLSLQSMLWALPQHVRNSSKPSFSSGGSHRGGDSLHHSHHQRQESFGSGADYFENINAEQQYPASYYDSSRPDLKQAILEAMQEIINEMDDMHKNINDQATSHIHSDEIILTVGYSKTIEAFLKFAHSKKRQFQVVVCESAPHYGGHEMAKSLASAGIVDTIVIHDSAAFAVMARVNKVLIPAHAVLANGGLVASSGCNTVALAAHYNSVPVVCVTGLFKLCPVYPHEGQDTLNDLLSPSCGGINGGGAGAVMDYAELSDPLLADVEFVNPVHDYIKPEHVNLYITNVGSFQPSFTYRLLAEYYHVDDWESFD